MHLLLMQTVFRFRLTRITWVDQLFILPLVSLLAADQLKTQNDEPNDVKEEEDDEDPDPDPDPEPDPEPEPEPEPSIDEPAEKTKGSTAALTSLQQPNPVTRGQKETRTGTSET